LAGALAFSRGSPRRQHPCLGTQIRGAARKSRCGCPGGLHGGSRRRRGDAPDFQAKQGMEAQGCKEVNGFADPCRYIASIWQCCDSSGGGRLLFPRARLRRGCLVLGHRPRSRSEGNSLPCSWNAHGQGDVYGDCGWQGDDMHPVIHRSSLWSAHSRIVLRAYIFGIILHTKTHGVINRCYSIAI